MQIAKHAATLGTIAMLALAAAPSPTRATPVSVGGGWTAFTWTNGPGVFQNESPFTFSATGPVTLDVTDAFANGDRFQVFNYAAALGLTSQVNSPQNPIPLTPDAAWALPNMSHGTWTLPAGTYSLTFKTVQTAVGAPSGTAFFRITSGVSLAEVPEPGSMALLGLGGVGLAFLRLRKRDPIPAI